MHVTFLDTETLGHDIDFQALSSQAQVWKSYLNTNPEKTREHIGDAEVVISNKVVIDKKIMLACPKLRYIAVCATGYNNIDIKAASELNIAVSNVTGYGTNSVAQHVLSQILCLATHIIDYHQDCQQGLWSESPQFCLMHRPVIELKNKTLGIIGYGELGAAVATLCQAIGMKILIGEQPNSPLRPGRTPFKELIEQSDFISLHCPLNDTTRSLIDADVLQKMKNSAYIINTARGGIVDETALIAALKNGTIAGAAVDVLTEEPPSLDHPMLDNSIPNLILTPHSAWTSSNARENMITMLADQLQSYRQGKIINPIHPTH